MAGGVVLGHMCLVDIEALTHRHWRWSSEGRRHLRHLLNHLGRCRRNVPLVFLRKLTGPVADRGQRVGDGSHVIWPLLTIWGLRQRYVELGGKGMVRHRRGLRRSSNSCLCNDCLLDLTANHLCFMVRVMVVGREFGFSRPQRMRGRQLSHWKWMNRRGKLRKPVTMIARPRVGTGARDSGVTATQRRVDEQCKCYLDLQERVSLVPKSKPMDADFECHKGEAQDKAGQTLIGVFA